MDESTQSPVNRRRSTAGQDHTANSSTPGVRVPASLPEETAATAQSGDRPGVKPATHASGEKGDGPHFGIVERVRERADAQLRTQKDKATDGIGTIARAIRGTTQELREQQHDTLAQYVDRAADELERLSSRLKNKDVGNLFQDAQKLARRQPVVFVGAAFAIGLLGARFLKSSAPQGSLPGTQPSREGLGVHAAGNS
jgi:hypothetical protein